MDVLRPNLPHSIPLTLEAIRETAVTIDDSAIKDEYLASEVANLRLELEDAQASVVAANIDDGLTVEESPLETTSPCTETYLDTLLHEIEAYFYYYQMSQVHEEDAATEIGVAPMKLLCEIRRLVDHPELFPSEEVRHEFLTDVAHYVHAIDRLANCKENLYVIVHNRERKRDKDHWESLFDGQHAKDEDKPEYVPWQDSTLIQCKDINDEVLQRAIRTNFNIPICQRVMPQSLVYILEHWRRENDILIDEMDDLTKDSGILDTQRAIDREIFPFPGIMDQDGILVAVEVHQPYGQIVHPRRARFPINTTLGLPSLSEQASMLCKMPGGYSSVKMSTAAWRILRVTTLMKVRAYQHHVQNESWSPNAI